MARNGPILNSFLNERVARGRHFYPLYINEEKEIMVLKEHCLLKNMTLPALRLSYELLELGFPVFPFFSCSSRTRGSRETVCMNSIARCASKQVEKYLFFVSVFPELLFTGIVGNTYLERHLYVSS